MGCNKRDVSLLVVYKNLQNQAKNGIHSQKKIEELDMEKLEIIWTCKNFSDKKVRLKTSVIGIAIGFEIAST